jgi:hypothetical protein
MKLSDDEVKLFYKVWLTMLAHMNDRHKVIALGPGPDGEPVPVRTEDLIKIRDAMWESPGWIDNYLADPDGGLETEEEREIVEGWREHFVRGKFVVMKHTAKHSVLMKGDRLYGVCGITDSLEETFPVRPPFMMETVLLPFKGKIIYDSLVVRYNVVFGPGMRSSFKRECNELKRVHGITEVLGADPPPPGRRGKPKRPAAPRGPRPAGPGRAAELPPGVNVPSHMADAYLRAAEVLSRFCDEKLDAEYKGICLRVLEKLCRKRPSPLQRGNLSAWACGVAHAVGTINFLFDRNAPLSSTVDELAGWFGVSKSTSGSKSAEVRRLLRLSYLDPEFSLRRILDNSPFSLFF